MKKNFIRFLAFLLAFQGAIAAQMINISSAHAAGTQEIVINELMWMGSEKSTADEWIELRNTTNAAVDLSGWTLTNASSGGDLVLASGTVPANGYFLISNFAAANASSVLNVTADLVTSSLSLDNTCQAIELLNASAEKIDEVGCSGASYLAGSNGLTKTAMERNIVVEDGLLSSSWHSSVGTGNLDLDAVSTSATPMLANDTTAPLTASAVVSDGSSADVDFTVNDAELTVNWSGFADSETEIDSYQVSLGTAVGLDDVVSEATVAVPASSYTFTVSSWAEDVTLFANVAATNAVGLQSMLVSSDGVTLNTVDPNAPTDVTVTDVAGDNGGSIEVNWTASSSADVVGYQVNYRVQGELAWETLQVGSVTSVVVSSLENSPVVYEVAVEAIDFNDQHSALSTVVTGQAEDNLAPVIDATKIVVTQSLPGSNDLIEGLVGAANELSTVNIFAQDPSLPGVMPIISVSTAIDGSFPSSSLGDNVYGNLWLQLVDQAGLASSVVTVVNDIVGPAATNLTTVVAECKSSTCRVELRWNQTDAVSYQVGYTVNGIEQRTLSLSTAGVSLDLPANESYEFAVYGFDQFGNVSAKSNVFSLRLTAGVKTTATLVGAEQVTTTEAMEGTKEVAQAKLPSGTAKLFGSAKAASSANEIKSDVGSSNEGTDSSSDETGSNGQSDSDPIATADSQDWVRITIVVILLLLVAAGFYALSRSFAAPAKSPAKDEPKTPAKSKTTQKKSGGTRGGKTSRKRSK